MQADAKFLDLPLKYAFIAALTFAGSAFVLGHMYQFLALSAMGMSKIGASWPQMQEISALSVDRTLRYFIFYFLIFLSLTCYMRSPARSSQWGLVILFAIIPLAAGIIPFLFSTGEFRSSPYWSMVAYLIALIFLGIGPKGGTKYQRIFFAALVITILVLEMSARVDIWLHEMEKMESKVSGNRYAKYIALDSLYYMAPAAIISIAVDIAMVYIIPRNYLKGQIKR